MFKNIRHRSWLIFGAALAVLIVRIFTDSNGVFNTASFLISMCTGIVILTLAHWGRKGYLDYGPFTDLRNLYTKAYGEPTGIGAAISTVSIAIFFLAFCMVFTSGRANAAVNVKTDIPHQAYPVIAILKAEVEAHWPANDEPELLMSLMEHESGCPSMPKKCFNAKTRLKSAREEGAGLGQITRAYRADGSERFDALQEMVDRYPALSGWSWANVYERPDLQVRAVVLKSKENVAFFEKRGASKSEAKKFGDAGYNGGNGGVLKEQRACYLKPGCDSQQWFGHVETMCMKSKAPLYGNRSACDINRHHVRDVYARAPKYRPFFA